MFLILYIYVNLTTDVNTLFATNPPSVKTRPPPEKKISFEEIKKSVASAFQNDNILEFGINFRLRSVSYERD
jgi:hypothetical protein